MTKDKELIYIDKETYFQIIGKEDEQAYQEFLENNPRFINQEIEKPKYQIDEKKLQKMHEHDEDFLYIEPLVRLEFALPWHEQTNKSFNYSKANLTRKQKCLELINYYKNVCGITSTEQIFKRSGRNR